MNGRRKRDAHKIIQLFNDLKHAPWIGNRYWWPDFLFHVTDIKNVASILNCGLMLSRSQLESQDITWEDSASQEIIDQTDTRLTDCVRFYFRPLTPTAFRNEGFKPTRRLYQNAHCPVPIYLLFDLKQIIALEKTKFSEGSLARRDYKLYESADDILRFKFKEIYHNKPFTKDEHKRIVNMRQAEVIFPKRVSLHYLKFMVVVT